MYCGSAEKVNSMHAVEPENYIRSYEVCHRELPAAAANLLWKGEIANGRKVLLSHTWIHRFFWKNNKQYKANNNNWNMHNVYTEVEQMRKRMHNEDLYIISSTLQQRDFLISSWADRKKNVTAKAWPFLFVVFVQKSINFVMALRQREITGSWRRAITRNVSLC